MYNNSNSQIGVPFISNAGLSFLNEAFHCFSKIRILWRYICNKRFTLYIYIFFFFKIYFIFWLWGVFVAAGTLSPVAVSRGCCSLRCPGFSLWWLLSLHSTGSKQGDFSSCGSQALEHKLSRRGTWASLLCSIWGLPRSGIVSVSLTLQGRFLIPEPPGKP